MTASKVAAPELSAATLLAYGGLALPLGLAGIPIVTFLPAYYAQELHLSAGLVGAVFLIARLWDAVSNVLIGWLSDRSMSRGGRRKPWVLMGAPFLMASTWYLCNPPAESGLAHLALWAVLFYTAWAAMYIPYLSWGTELASDYGERSRVASFRETFTMLGNLFFVSAPLIFLSEGAPLQEVLLLIALTVVVLVPLTVLPLGLCVRDLPPEKRLQTRLFKELAGVAQDRVMRRFVLATLCYAVGEGVINSVIVFYFNVGLELPNKLFWSIFILYVSTISMVPLMLRVARRVEKHHLVAAGVAVQVLTYGALVQIPSGNFPLVAGLWVLLGVANSAVMILPTSILADITEHGEAISGERRSGAYAAMFNLAMKLGLALGVGLSFGLLELLNYDPGAAQHSADDVRNLRWVTGGLAALVELPVIFLYLKHPISRAVQRQLRAQIEFRQSASGAH